jgi:hypothetical protein
MGIGHHHMTTAASTGSSALGSVLVALGGLALSLYSPTAAGGVSSSELQAYLATRPKAESYEASIGPVVDAISLGGTRETLTKARSVLADRWHVSREAADALIELVILTKAGDRGPPGTPSDRRFARIVGRVVADAAESPEAWLVVIWHLDKSDRCNDSALQTQYFRKSWAANSYLGRDDYSCKEWIYSLPSFASPTPLFYARLVEESEYRGDADVAGRLAAAHAFTDFLRREGVSTHESVRLYAERHYLTLLGEWGLTDQILEDGKDLAQSELFDILNGEAHESVTFNGHELENPPYALRIAKDAQTEWVAALLERGKQAEARDWLARYAMQPPAGEGRSDFADEQDVVKTAREVLRRVATNSSDDIFDLLFEAGSDPGRPILGSLDSPAARQVTVGYLKRVNYTDVASYLQTLSCTNYSDDEEDSHTWAAFPADFQTAQQQFGSEILKARQRHSDCPTSEHSSIPADIGRRQELPLPPAMRSIHTASEKPRIPAYARAALAHFNIVRYSALGDLTAAISLSQYVDPTGEVSGGGYWLHLSPDHGHSWRPPLYLGLEQYVPYVVAPRSRLPLVRGRTLQIEVQVREIDIERIMFPPVAVPTKRQAKDLYIELSLDEIERDSDGDGLTDILEEKLGTNPNDPDTDHDGLRDDVDPIPQASRTAHPVADSEVVQMTLHAVFGYDEAAIHTGGPVTSERQPSVLESLFSNSDAREPGAAPSILFVEGDPTLFQGLTLPGRMIVMTPEQVEKIRSKYGLFYPVQFHFMFNHARTRAIVIWSAGWTGGTLRFQKTDGQWQPPTRDGWIS